MGDEKSPDVLFALIQQMLKEHEAEITDELRPKYIRLESDVATLRAEYKALKSHVEAIDANGPRSHPALESKGWSRLVSKQNIPYVLSAIAILALLACLVVVIVALSNRDIREIIPVIP